MTDEPIELGERGEEIVARTNQHTTDEINRLGQQLADFDGHEQRIAALETTVGQLADAMSVLRSDMEGADNALHERLDELDRTLTGRLDVQQVAIDAQAAMIATLRSDLTAQGLTLADHETRIKALEDKPDDPPPPPKWTEKTSIDCSVIDARLYLYDGWHPANGQGPRDTSQIVVMDEGDGPFLRFRSEPVTEPVQVWNKSTKQMDTFPKGAYVSAGASILEKHGSITYGAVEVEARAVQASKGTRIAILLWPDQAGVWPAAEEDYPEVSGDGEDQARQRVGWNGHYEEKGVHKQHQARFPVNMLDWHTYRIEWSPDLIVCYIDGEEVGRRTENVPTVPMHPCVQTALQSADKGKARPGTTPGGVDVKGWRVYEWTPSP